MKKKGGYAFNKDSIKAIESKANANGVNVHKGVKVTGFKRGSNSNAITGVETDQGNICLLYTSPSPRDLSTSRMPSSA